MKTITAKEFQLQQSTVLKEVAGGQRYQVTFHRKPLVILSPAQESTSTKPRPGTYQAVLESLKYTAKKTNLPLKPDYKSIYREGLRIKYER